MADIFSSGSRDTLTRPNAIGGRIVAGIAALAFGYWGFGAFGSGETGMGLFLLVLAIACTAAACTKSETLGG